MWGFTTQKAFDILTTVPQNDLVNKEEYVVTDPALQEMIDAGVFYGRSRTRTNPRMRQYVAVERNNFEIIDLEKTKELLEKAVTFVKEKIRHHTLAFVIGTQAAGEEGVLALAKEFNLPAVIRRWLGGTLTNFKVISHQLEYYKKLKSDWENEAFRNKYTKKEQIGIEREIRRMEELFGPLVPMTERPSLLIVIDPELHTHAMREARQLGIPVIALANTDANPDEIDYPVVGNTKAKSSIDWFLGRMAGAIRAGRLEAVVPAIAPVGESKDNKKAE